MNIYIAKKNILNFLKSSFVHQKFTFDKRGKLAEKTLLKVLRKKLKKTKILNFFNILPRYIKVKVEHYLLFMFSPPKIS